MNISDESMMNARNAFEKSFNHTLHVYVDITGDLIAGTLLSQILYWFSPTSDGKEKVRVMKENCMWIAKRREDWWNEIRITPKQYDRAIKILQDKGFVESKLFRFKGHATTHIRPIPEKINQTINLWIYDKALFYEKQSESTENTQISPKGESIDFPEGKNYSFPQRVNLLTENTITENTNKDIKFRNNNYTLSNNEPYIIPKTESDVCQSPPYNIYKDNLIDIHNNEQLAHILENVTSIPKGNEGHDYIYFLFSTFAKEYKKHKGYKHKRIDYEKLLRYADKLIKFTPMNLNTGESYPEKCNYSFSIFNYEKEDIEYMVKDFFAADIRESDHSLHLFMSDNILRARFWRLENKYAEASSY
jgi:hypothetical protein